MTKHKSLTECPKCGCEKIFILPFFHEEFSYNYGKVFRPQQVLDCLKGKIKATCNYTPCKQLFWYYPNTGRVTRRNK